VRVISSMLVRPQQDATSFRMDSIDWQVLAIEAKQGNVTPKAAAIAMAVMRRICGNRMTTACSRVLGRESRVVSSVPQPQYLQSVASGKLAAKSANQGPIVHFQRIFRQF